MKGIINKKSQEDKYKDLHFSTHNVKMNKDGDLTVGYIENKYWLGSGIVDIDKIVTKLERCMEFLDDCANQNI